MVQTTALTLELAAQFGSSTVSGMVSRKTVLMKLSVGQEERPRLVDTVGEGEGGVN